MKGLEAAGVSRPVMVLVILALAVAAGLILAAVVRRSLRRRDRQRKINEAGLKGEEELAGRLLRQG